jgi:hypothetical protein
MSLDLLKVTVTTCCILASASLAETETVRLGAHFRDAAGNPFQRLGSVTEALNRQKLDMQQFVKGLMTARHSSMDQSRVQLLGTPCVTHGQSYKQSASSAGRCCRLPLARK